MNHVREWNMTFKTPNQNKHPLKRADRAQSKEGKVGKTATASGQAVNESEMELAKMRSAEEKRQQPPLLGPSQQTRAGAHSLLFPYSSLA